MGEYYYQILSQEFNPNAPFQIDTIVEYLYRNKIISLDSTRAIEGFNNWRKHNGMLPTVGFIFCSEHPRLIISFIDHLLCTIGTKPIPVGNFVKWMGCSGNDYYYNRSSRFRDQVVDKCSDFVKSNHFASFKIKNLYNGLYIEPTSEIEFFEFSLFDILFLYNSAKNEIPIRRLHLSKVPLNQTIVSHPKYKDQVVEKIKSYLV